jgi:hypothetical protein
VEANEQSPNKETSGDRRPNSLHINDLGRPGRRKPLTVNDLENFYPPVAFRLGNDGIPSILPLLISEGSRGVLINEFVHNDFFCVLNVCVEVACVWVGRVIDQIVVGKHSLPVIAPYGSFPEVFTISCEFLRRL